MQSVQHHRHVSAPPTKRRRSVALGCFGLFIAAGAGLFVIRAVAALTAEGEAPPGALLGGLCMAVVATLGLAATVFGFRKRTVPGQADFAEAKELREQFLSAMDTSDALSQQINAAAGLMLDRRYEECIAAYQAIADAHPEQRGTAYGQIGAALYFLGRYEEAIQHYEQALALGEDPEGMRENIEEARQALR